MISNQELKLVDREYFNILQMNGFTIGLQSKNTKHYWHIIEEEFTHFRHFKIYHKHNKFDELHRHSDAATLVKALEKIVDHDSFQINGRRFRHTGKHTLEHN